MKTLILSDLHIGNGGRYDIFEGAQFLPALLRANLPQPLRVVLNGDSFDFLLDDAPLKLTPTQALRQFQAILDFDPNADLFKALREVLAAGGEIWVRVGNHDLELALPEVQQALRTELRVARDSPAVRFQNGDAPAVLEMEGVKILLAHGEHNDRMNRIDYSRLPRPEVRPLPADGEDPALGAAGIEGDGFNPADFEYPAGSLFVKDLLHPLKRDFGMRFVDLLKPDFEGGALTALAVNPKAFKLVLSKAPYSIAYQLFRERNRLMVFTASSLADGPRLSTRLMRAGLSEEEYELIRFLLETDLEPGDEDGPADGTWLGDDLVAGVVDPARDGEVFGVEPGIGEGGQPRASSASSASDESGHRLGAREPASVLRSSENQSANLESPAQSGTESGEGSSQGAPATTGAGPDEGGEPQVEAPRSEVKFLESRDIPEPRGQTGNLPLPRRGGRPGELHTARSAGSLSLAARELLLNRESPGGPPSALAGSVASLSQADRTYLLNLEPAGRSDILAFGTWTGGRLRQWWRGTLDQARTKLGRAAFRLYARAHRSWSAEASREFFSLEPDPSELSEARGLQRDHEVQAVLMGHSHAARWAVEPGCVYANTGTWIGLMRLPGEDDSDQVWMQFLEGLRKDPGLEDPANPAKVERFFSYVQVEPQADGVKLALCCWEPTKGAVPLRSCDLKPPRTDVVPDFGTRPAAVVTAAVTTAAEASTVAAAAVTTAAEASTAAATVATAVARSEGEGRPCPIVLAHGIARFDVLWRSDNERPYDSIHYWRNVRTLLQEHGHEVYHTNVSWSGGVDLRARQLAEQIRALLASQPAGQKVNIIAHSMGGLDARVAIAEHGLAPRVASLTTLGTPHHGSAFADWGFETGLAPSVMYLLAGLGIDPEGMADLTTRACAQRNARLRPFEDRNEHGILYQTYAGVQALDDIFALLAGSALILRAREGANDGLVSERSARWDDRYFRGTLDADHLNLLGWWDLAELDFVIKGRTEARFYQYIHRFFLELAAGLPRA